MNSQSLKTKINNNAKKYNVFPQDLMQMYFFERLLYRISVSKYKNNFILKGGLLLSALFGNANRTTQDMDTMIKGIEVDSNQLIKIIKEIIDIDCNDNIKFKILKTNNIRVEDKYGGTRISLLGEKEEIKVNLKIDITTKDPIVPREIQFQFKSMFDDSYISIMAFTKESMIAEKFETLIEDVESDTRAKDFYDLYMLMNLDINMENLKKAIIRTFKRRNRNDLFEEMVERFEVIKNSVFLKKYWENYQNTHPYARNIHYTDIIEKIEIILTLF